MENTPEKSSNNRRKKKHSATRIYRRMVVLIFSLFVIVVAYLVYNALNNGIGLPVSSVGRTDHQLMQNVTDELPDDSELTDPTELSSSEQVQTTEPTENYYQPEPQELAQLYLEDMTLEEMVWQMMFVTTNDIDAPDGTHYPVGGVYFREQDLTDVQAIEDSIFGLQVTQSVPAMYGLTHEGGSIEPLSDIGLVDSVSTMRTYGNAGDAEAIYQVGLKMGQQIAAAGFHFNLAPVADTFNWYPADTYNLQNRTFGTNEAVDSGVLQKMVAQMVKGMQEGGTIACLKHFPNLASTAQSDLGDFSWLTYEKFSATDLKPFIAGIESGVDMVMVSNMYAPNLTNGVYVPCFRAKEVVTNLLRNELGFHGVIITDEQSKQNDVSNIVAAIEAGCDVIYLPANAKAAVDAIVEAVANGKLTQERIEESAYRILLLKCEYGIITE